MCPARPEDSGSKRQGGQLAMGNEVPAKDGTTGR
jgi:hypothetical protein